MNEPIENLFQLAAEPEEAAPPVEEAAPEPEVKTAEPEPPKAPEPPKDDDAVRAERLQNALHESRQQAREAKEAADKLRQEIDAREARMAEFVKAKFAEMQPKPAEPPRPDRDEDPAGYMEWENRQLKDRLEKLETTAQQNQSRQVEMDQISDLQRAIQADEQQFIQKTPDYLNAVGHVQNHYSTVMEMQGFQPADIAKELQVFGTRFGASQLQMGKEPAAQFYELAKRLGYQPPSPTSAPETPAAPAVKDSPLDMIEKGQKQAGLGGGGGDIQKEDESPDDEFPLLTQAMKEIGFV